MTDKGKRKDEELVRKSTEPIPIMTEDEAIANTARDFNVTSGVERSGSESDTEVDTGTDDIGSTPSRANTKRSSKRGGKTSRSSSGKKKAGQESDVAKSDADTSAILTEESGGTSAKSGTESRPTSESKGTSAKSEIF